MTVRVCAKCVKLSQQLNAATERQNALPSGTMSPAWFVYRDIRVQARKGMIAHKRTCNV